MTKTLHLTQSQGAWLAAPRLARLFDALGRDPSVLRVVGGAVRDTLADRPVDDIDLATSLTPETVIARLTKAGLKYAPTGLAHGTVTAIVDGKGFEITTLRHDVETDGRHATVAFTDDWQADAARRDFTMNALYADATGLVTDYYDGLADLIEGRVRFIGDATARIDEDALRILRFFRFHAWYGRGNPDAEGYAACCDRAAKLARLSCERVWKEISRLLAAPDPAPICRAMLSGGIFNPILPEIYDIKPFARFLELEETFDLAPESLPRLMALVAGDAVRLETVGQKLRLSRKTQDMMQHLARLTANLATPTVLALRLALYDAGRGGADDLRLALALHCARDPQQSPEIWRDALHETLADWVPVAFPLQGRDLLPLGVPEGPALGELLESLESWWKSQDLRPDKQACLTEAGRRLKASKACQKK